jgi:hypothetical protein
VEGTVTWLAREMTSPEGLFYSALDADSEHEEGRFYVWTLEQAAALLTPEEYRVAAAHWGLDRAPNFEDHAWHLGEERPLESVAHALGMAPDAAQGLLESARAKLFAARAGRVRPGRDDKCLTAWNALAIKGLARAARRCDRRDWLAMARRAAAALLRLVWRDGRLAASFQGGRARHNGYLDDYAFLLDALLELAQAGWGEGELAWARELAEALLAHFEDMDAGGFFFTSHDHERLIHRSKPAHDQAMPSGNGIAAVALGRLGHLIEEPSYQTAGERTLRAFQGAIADHPAPFPSLLTALREQLVAPSLVILRGPDAALQEWKQAADRVAAPGALVFALPRDAQDVPASLSRPFAEHVQAHVCATDKCLPPIVQLHDLLTILSARTDA